MPWRLQATKDVAACEKPRGVGKQTLIRGCPNGETQRDELTLRPAEYIGWYESTQGSEPSQYLEENKSNEIPIVAASELGSAQTIRACSLGL